MDSMQNSKIVKWQRHKLKDSLDYFYTLKSVNAKHGSEVSIPEAAKLVSLTGDWAEFGVFRGSTAHRILKVIQPNAKLYLFDSFEGLSEDWREGFKKGAFKLEKSQIPKFDDKLVILKIGYFKDTVPAFGKEHLEPLAFIHIDCDIYSSTICVLEGLNNIIAPGTVIVFDELYNYQYFWKHEYRALQEFTCKHNRQFEYCGRSNKSAAWIKIIK